MHATAGQLPSCIACQTALHRAQATRFAAAGPGRCWAAASGVLKGHAPFQPKILPDGTEKSEVWALLGEQDDLISPIQNFEILQNIGATIRMGKHGHRTPIEAFQGVFDELIKTTLYTK